MCGFWVAEAQFPAGGMGGGNSGGITGKIEGILLDTLTKQPIEFATVVLVKPKSKTQVDGTITDERGRFKFAEAKLGNYSLNVSFLGYETKVVEGIQLLPEKPDANLGNVFLAASGVDLTEVVVETKAATIENKVDKIVYNAEQDATNTGGDASEVLQKVPMLSVDMNGNVSLRGSSNVQILINGKPSGIFASSVADALKSIPADDIKKVEVITTPGAKYDGEGSAGIVNIITKKRTDDGINGSVNASVGTRNNNAGLNLGISKGRFGMSGGGNFMFMWPSESSTSAYRETYNEAGEITSILDQAGSSTFQRLGAHGQFAAFYDFNAYNAINSSFSLRGFKRLYDGPATTELFDSNKQLLASFTNDVDNNILMGGLDWTLDYKKTFPTKGKEWSVAFQLSNGENNTDYSVNRQYLLNTDLDTKENSINDGNNREYTMQTDYAHPFNENLKLETGVKALLRNIDSDYNYSVFNDATNQYETDNSRTNVFNYFQNVYAGYLSSTFGLSESVSVIAGVRYEYTDIHGDYQTGSGKFANTYDSWLPSIIVSKQLKNNQSLKASYARRIQRPSIRFINPYSNDSDPLNITLGNPYLAPELNDQYDLNYNLIVKGLVLNTSVYYKYTDGLIESYSNVVDATTVTSYQNLGTSKTVGFNLFGSGSLAKGWTLRGNFNLGRFNIESGLPDATTNNKGINYNVFLSTGYKFKNGYEAEVFSFWNSPRYTLQGKNPSFSMMTFGFKKSIFKDQGSIGIRIVDPFQKNKSFKSEIKDDSFYSTSNFELPFRSFGLNLSYKFGKTDQQRQRTRKSKIKNDDEKADDSNNMGN